VFFGAPFLETPNVMILLISALAIEVALIFIFGILAVKA